MLRITMIRHGRTEGSSKGKFIGITDEPILNSEKKALSEIKFPPVDEVYSSPMKRCIETAQILYPDNEINVIDELSECDFGDFEGKTYQELLRDPIYKGWVKSGEISSYPNGERRSDFQERCIHGFEKVIRDAVSRRRRNIALIVHDGTIMSILGAYGFPAQDYRKWTAEYGEGYRLRIVPEPFMSDNNIEQREIIVDGKIIRDGN